MVTCELLIDYYPSLACGCCPLPSHTGSADAWLWGHSPLGGCISPGALSAQRTLLHYMCAINKLCMIVDTTKLCLSLLTFLLDSSPLPEGRVAVCTSESPIVYLQLQFFGAFSVGRQLSVCVMSCSGGETCLLLATEA